MKPTPHPIQGFTGLVERDRSLAAWTTWRIGGPAEWVASPTDVEQLTLALRWAAENGLRVRVMGNGSNLLIADAGLQGLVLRLRKVLDTVEGNAESGQLVVGAGASFPALARYAAGRGFSGLEFATGIPGTVGGAITMNAGWHEHETRQFVRYVDAISHAGVTRRFSAEECRFGYRNSRFRSESWILTSVCFDLPPGDPQEIRARLDRFAASRKENQPTTLPSCGSVFVQPEGDFAGRLIDRAGLKGAREGGIEVSSLHANFFVNRGDGTAADVLRLAARVEAGVLADAGVALVREFEYWTDEIEPSP